MQNYRKLFEKIYNLIFSGSFHDHNQGNDILPICIICTFWNILWNTLLGLNKIKDLTKLLLTSFKLFILWSIAIILHYLTRNKYIYFHKLIFYHYRYLYWFMPPKKHFHTIENVIREQGCDFYVRNILACSENHATSHDFLQMFPFFS